MVRKSLRAVFMYVLMDTLQSYSASTVHGTFRGLETNKIPIGFGDYPWTYQLTYAWLHTAIAYSNMELLNAAYGVAAIIFGFANPRDCPSSFGDLKEMYTIRRAWSSVLHYLPCTFSYADPPSVVWHQNCRRICSAPGIFLARDVLQLRRGSFASKYLQLFVAFFISAAIHGGAAMLSHRSLDDDNSFAVFMAQAIAILVEDHVIDLGRYLGFHETWIWKDVGYIWTVLWIGLSFAPYTSAMLGHGIWIHRDTGNFFSLGPMVI